MRTVAGTPTRRRRSATAARPVEPGAAAAPGGRGRPARC